MIATYYGGSGQIQDSANDIKVDPAGYVHLGGVIGEASLTPGSPLSDGNPRAFVALFSNDLTQLLDFAEVGSGGTGVSAIAIGPAPGGGTVEVAHTNPRTLPVLPLITYVAGEFFPELTLTIYDGTSDYPVDDANVIAAVVSPTAVRPSFLTVEKSHTGNFKQGQQGATFTVVVADFLYAAPTTGPVTVTETMPPGLTLVSMSGSGWTCIPGSNTCTRSDVLAPGKGYPPITVTVNVLGNAATPQQNQVVVSGGGQQLPTTGFDSVNIVSAAVIEEEEGVDLLGGDDEIGGTATFTITVTDVGGLATSSTITVNNSSLPTGVTIISLGGTGWNCPKGNAFPCNYTASVAAGGSSSVLQVTVSFGSGAPAVFTFGTTASGPGLTGVFSSVTIKIAGGAQTCTIGITAGTFDPADTTALLPDIVITCWGGQMLAAGSAAPMANLTVYTPSDVTSRILATVNNVNYSEALVLIDDPGSNETAVVPGFGPQANQTFCWTACQTFVNNIGGHQVGTSTPNGTTPGPNVFPCVMSTATSVTCTVPNVPSASTDAPRVYRITNVRINDTTLTSGSNVYLALSGLTFTDPTAVAGVVGSPATSTVTVPANPVKVPSAAGFAGIVNFQENSATAFKTRVDATANTPGASTSGAPVQNIPGAVYNSESGFTIPPTNFPSSTLIAGLADSGTRIKTVFSNIPSGVGLYVSESTGNDLVPGGTSNTPDAVLLPPGTAETAVDGSFTFGPPYIGSTTAADGSTVVPLSIVNGVASAIYEVVNTNPAAPNTFSFMFYVAAVDHAPPTPAILGTMVVTTFANLTPSTSGGSIPTNVFTPVQSALVPLISVPVSITVDTNPAGLLFNVDGGPPTEPESFTWSPGNNISSMRSPHKEPGRSTSSTIGARVGRQPVLYGAWRVHDHHRQLRYLLCVIDLGIARRRRNG